MREEIKSLVTVIKEFLKALIQSRTYNVRKNWYCLFGLLWGIPVPVVTIGIDIYSAGLPLSFTTIIGRILYHPIHFFFLLHPVLFGIVFGAMGTVRYNKEQRIREFEENLIIKNKELKEANKKLQELDKIKSSFLSMVSHELRTPLTTIQGYISFLRSSKAGSLNETQVEILKLIEEESEYLNNLIEELLDLSSIEKGKFKVNLEKVQLKEIVDKAIATLRPLAERNQVSIENYLSRDLPLVWADRQRIFQAITNLLENAIKFNKPGGKVTVSCSDSKNDKLLFQVSDTGIGIKEDELNKIFDKFYQIEKLEKRKFSGCGLGLAITKSIIELHGGTIRVESQPGAGSKFYFELRRIDKQTISPAPSAPQI